MEGTRASATKQRSNVMRHITGSLIELWNLGSDSHEAAMAEDRLREAEFWVSKIRIDRDTDELAEEEDEWSPDAHHSS